MNNEIEKINLNPFNTYQVEIIRVFDENKCSVAYISDYVDKHAVITENEFYVLFESNSGLKQGTLLKKGRSGVRTSEYLSDKKVINRSIKEYYESLQEL